MPFRGYFEVGDPRSSVFAAGGATWPTVPPYRWRLGCPNANLAWHFLKDPGVLFELWAQQTHDSTTWQATDGIPPDFCTMRLTRSWLPITSIILWWWRITFPAPTGPKHVLAYRTPGVANKNLVLARVDLPGAPPGIQGKTATFHQVRWDEENPPGGWPP